MVGQTLFFYQNTWQLLPHSKRLFYNSSSEKDDLLCSKHSSTHFAYLKAFNPQRTLYPFLSKSIQFPSSLVRGHTKFIEQVWMARETSLFEFSLVHPLGMVKGLTLNKANNITQTCKSIQFLCCNSRGLGENSMRDIYSFISILQMRKPKHRQFKETDQGFMANMWQSQKSCPGTKAPKSVSWRMLDCPTKLSFFSWPVLSPMHVFTVVFLEISLGRLARVLLLFFPEFNLSTDFDYMFYYQQDKQVLVNEICCFL